jgi:hypothetical protein
MPDGIHSQMAVAGRKVIFIFILLPSPIAKVSGVAIHTKNAKWLNFFGFPFRIMRRIYVN